MTDKTEAQAALIVLALGLPLRDRLKRQEAIELLEDLVGLPHELCLDQRKVVAGTGQTRHERRREEARLYHVSSRSAEGGELFTLADAAIIMGLAESTLISRTTNGREYCATRTNPWQEMHEDILTCSKVNDPDEYEGGDKPLSVVAADFVLRRRIAIGVYRNKMSSSERERLCREHRERYPNTSIGKLGARIF